jgi:peroxiredoxin
MLRSMLAVVALFAVTAAVHAQEKAELGQAAPGFSLKDASGKTHSLADYAGKIVVLEWTNPQCPIVQRHYKAGTMTRLAEKYGDKIVWLAINSTSSTTPEENQKWAQKHGVKFPILLDQSGQVGKSYAAKTTPHIYIIDASGKLAYRGGIDDDSNGDKKEPTPYVAHAIDALLAGKSVENADTKPYGCSVKYAK